ncbi:unnamed protein product [Camellia sinensis]
MEGSVDEESVMFDEEYENLAIRDSCCKSSTTPDFHSGYGYVLKSENMKKFFDYIQLPNFNVAANAIETFKDRFDPIADSNTILRNVGDQEFEGMYCAILSVKYTISKGLRLNQHKIPYLQQPGTNLVNSFLTWIDRIARVAFETIRKRGTKLCSMAFLSSLNQIASIEWESMSGEFMPEFFKLVLGNPFSAYQLSRNKLPLRQENIVSMLRRLVEERRACQETKHDMLGLLMNGGEENRYNLTDEEKIDQMIAIM